VRPESAPSSIDPHIAHALRLAAQAR